MTDPGFPLPTDDELSPEAREVIAALPPLNVFRAVAALPASLRPFLELGASLLAGQNLTPAERELVILRVAHLTDAGYERHQHEQLAAAVGLDAGQIAATASTDPAAGLDGDGALICAATDEITRDVRLSDATLARIRGRWGDDGARELILTAAYYNMVSRYLESTRVPLEETNVLGDADPEQLVREGRERTESEA